MERGREYAQLDTKETYSATPGDDEPRQHKLTAAEQTATASDMMKRAVGYAKDGLAAASLAAIGEVHELKARGLSKSVAANLETVGTAGVIRDTNGNPTHLIFGDQNNSKAIDIDLKNETLNGKTAEELRKASVEQAKDYFNAQCDDMRIKDRDGQEIGPEARKATKELMGAILDGDKAALGEVSKNILKNPELTEKVRSAFEAIQRVGIVNVERDTAGNQHIGLVGLNEAPSINKDGKLEDGHYDYSNRTWNFSPAKNGDRSITNVRDFGLYTTTGEILNGMAKLSAKNQLPAEGAKNMKTLEQAIWTDRLNE